MIYIYLFDIDIESKNFQYQKLLTNALSDRGSNSNSKCLNSIIISTCL